MKTNELPDLMHLPRQYNGTLKQLHNAMTNKIYHLSTQDGQYLVRVLGPMIHREHEITLLKYLGEQGHPVKIEYEGKGYRIETWIDHQSISHREMVDRFQQVASNFSWLHSLQPPIEKTNVLFKFLKPMLQDAKLDCPLDLEDYNEDLVLCHNDLQHGNLLDCNGQMVMVDFEYGGYAPRWFDIANHFCEYMYNYDQGMGLNLGLYPSKSHRLAFYASYQDASKAQLMAMDEKVGKYTLLSHLFWSTWAMYKAKNSLDFDYLSYSQERWNRLQYCLNHKVNEHTCR